MEAREQDGESGRARSEPTTKPEPSHVGVRDGPLRKLLFQLGRMRRSMGILVHVVVRMIVVDTVMVIGRMRVIVGMPVVVAMVMGMTMRAKRVL